MELPGKIDYDWAALNEVTECEDFVGKTELFVDEDYWLRESGLGTRGSKPRSKRRGMQTRHPRFREEDR